MGYWESPALKERIALHYRERYGVAVEAEQILLTCGASPGLVLALSGLFAPGARVAKARPGYVAYRNTLKALYLEQVEIGCGPAERYQRGAAALGALGPAPDGQGARQGEHTPGLQAIRSISSAVYSSQ